MSHGQEDIAQAAEADDLAAPAQENGSSALEVKDQAEPPTEIQAQNPPASPEDGSMLDIHAPHEGIHNWKQYLLHMSTVVLGILIAIGLEQSVEAMHRAHERSELRESLQRDTEQAIRVAKTSEDIDVPSIDWIDSRRALVETALATHRPLTAPLPRKPHVESVQPGDPAWNAAKSSGMLSLLTQDEVEVYSLADQLIADSQAAFTEGVGAAKKRGEFEFGHAVPSDSGAMDLSKATPAELRRYREVLADEASAWTQYRVLCEYVRGVETAIGAGERDLDKVQHAKTRYYQNVVK